MNLRWTLALLLLAVGEPANSVTPTSPEQVLCWNDALVRVVVEEARSHDCGMKYECSPMVGVTGRVEGVIQPSIGPFQLGIKVAASIRVIDGKPMKIADRWVPMNRGGYGTLSWPVTEGVITTAAAKRELIGKHLILALKPVREITTSFGPEADAHYRAQIGEPYLAAAYEPREEEWVRKTWANASCRTWWH